jgi:hypothetical protein
VAVAVLALLLAALPFARAAESQTIADPSCGTITLVPRPEAPVLALGHSFLRAGSDSMWSARGPWRPGLDYSLDRVRGELRLLRDALPGETLYVHACWLLAPPPLEVQHYRYRPARDRDSAAAVAAPVEPRPITAHATAPPSGASLTLNGNKTLAVEFGSQQDAVLRQSLDLALSGTLAPGIQLTGVLTDRNTPVTASGGTLDLQAADQVRLELTAPQGGATLGDLSLRFDDGQFARLERRLQGVRAEWSGAGFRGVASAASAAGEYNRMEFLGTDGQQGPYILTDRDGGTGITVVAGSEVVTLDGTRLTRGESADYSMDYERARITFTNRHLITSASRITIDYQFALRRYRRNFTAASARWDRGALYGFTRLLTEGDDRGRPLGAELAPEDRVALALAGDSVSRAIGPGVTSGGGDYDTVRVSGGRLVYAFVGPDSGKFSVQFAPVGAGRGDYADSAVVSGRTAYRFVGTGLGGFLVGRALPFAESHSLWAAGAGARMGPLSMEVEGAASHHDLNTFSSLDDQHDAGYAGRATLRLEGSPRLLGGRGALSIESRKVDPSFDPFARLELPFEAEHWALPTGADFEHAGRLSVLGEWKPRMGGTLQGDVGAIRTPDGFTSRRTSLNWNRDGTFATQGEWERSTAEHSDWLSSHGGRDHMRFGGRWALPWMAPALRFERDERRFPSDTGKVGDRFIAGGAELGTGTRVAWHALGGYDLRRDARRTAVGFEDQSEARTFHLALDSPSGGAIGVSLLAQRRDVLPLADPTRTRSDLATARFRAEPGHGLKGELDLEISSEGENRRDRTLVFVGAGKGAYDAFGNFVGTGDYNLVLSVTSALDRLARAATRGRAAWSFGNAEAWRGSRVEFTFESEARRLGDLHASDPVVSPGAALGDPGLERGSVLQRLESELAPQSRAAALRFRLERRVNADRSFDNFAQTTDQREANVRWRARPASAFSTELEATARQQSADQILIGLAQSHRVIEGRQLDTRLIYTPDARFRLAGVTTLGWTRPEGQIDDTRVIEIGPDLGVTVGKRGHGDFSARRAFTSGPPAVALIPTADPAGSPRWQGTTRFDYRLLESFTLGLSASVREFPGRSAITAGRAEMRAFF